jgi:sugar lactone lactonase YvrE
MKTRTLILSIFTLLLLQVTAQAQIISTVAGGGATGVGDGGAATNCELNNPIGVVDADGNIYVADRNHHRIRKIITSTGIITTVAGIGVSGFSGDGGPATNAKIASPYGVAVDNSGNVYFTEGITNGRIRKINTFGIISTVAGGGTGGLGDGGPATNAVIVGGGIVVDAANNIFIADGINHRVRRVNAAGIITTIAGGGPVLGDDGQATAAKMNLPYAITLDAGGNIYVSEDYGARVRKINTLGIITTVAGTGVSGYSGDGGLATNAKISRPVGLAVDAGGNIYISEGGNNIVRKVSSSGIISTIAGTGTAGFMGDGGNALDAQLSAPTGVAIGTAGNLYISDFGNNRIRSLSNVVSIVSQNAAERQQPSINIYPKPNSGNFNIHVSTMVNERVTITITDILGRAISWGEVESNKPTTIRTDAPNGMYIVKANTEGWSISAKVLIEH